MNYPKQVMTIKELRQMGFPDEWLRTIYRSRNQKIAWKMGGEDKPHKIAKSSEWFDYCITDRLMSQYDTKEKIIKAMNDEEKVMQEVVNDMWICTEEEKGEET